MSLSSSSIGLTTLEGNSDDDYGWYTDLDKDDYNKSEYRYSKKRGREGYTLKYALTDLLKEHPYLIDDKVLGEATTLNVKSLVPGDTQLDVMKMGICERLSARRVCQIVGFNSKTKYAESLKALFHENSFPRISVDRLSADLFIGVEKLDIVNTRLDDNKTIILEGYKRRRMFVLQGVVKELSGNKYITYTRDGENWMMSIDDDVKIVEEESKDSECTKVLFYFKEFN